MEQLIFVGVIVLFSILEAIGRKKKMEHGGEGEVGEVPPPPPTSRRREMPAPVGPPGGPAGPASYDDDASYDEKAGAGRSSEGLIPADIWEEIAALARGEVPPSRAPEPSSPRMPPPAPTPAPAPAPRPAPAPPSGTGPRTPQPRTPSKARPGEGRRSARPAPTAPAPIRGRRAVTPGPTPEPALEELREAHPLHATHPGMGEPVRDRLTAPAEASRDRVQAEVAEVRRLLRSGSTASLRKAVILSEVLGPPPGLRDGG